MGSGKIQGELWGAAAERWATEQERTAWPLWTDVLGRTPRRAGDALARRRLRCGRWQR